MFNRLISEKYYCGLDIGAHKLKVGLFDIKNVSSLEPIGIYETDIYGFTNGSVSNLAELTECIHESLDQLTKKTGIKIKTVQLGVSSDLVESRTVTTVIPLLDKKTKIIGVRDVKKVNEQARLLGAKLDEEILHDLPQYYQIDESNVALNPVGLYGRKLGVQSLMVVSNSIKLKNLTKAVYQAGFDVENVFFSSYAASKIVLSPEERKEGVVLVDIGSSVTSLLLFKDNVLKYFKRVSIGGDDFTHKIASDLSIPFNLAEQIKKSYAIASPEDGMNEEEILVKRDDAYIPFQRRVICESIEPVVQSLVGQVIGAINESQLVDQVNQGLVFLGGGVLLNGLIERFDQQVKYDAKLAKIVSPHPMNIENAAVFSSVIGLALKGYTKSLKQLIHEQSDDSWTKRFAFKVKELYQEYF